MTTIHHHHHHNHSKPQILISDSVKESIWIDNSQNKLHRYCNYCDNWVGYKTICSHCHNFQFQNDRLLYGKKDSEILGKEWTRLRMLSETEWLKEVEDKEIEDREIKRAMLVGGIFFVIILIVFAFTFR